MFVQRLRGLVNLHAVATALAALLLLFSYAAFVRYLPYVRLETELNLVPYVLCVSLGMLISSRYVQELAGRFHRLTWVDALSMATKQIFAVVLLVFAFMFAFKDREMSRLFMGTYLVMCWCLLVLINRGLPRLLSVLFFANNHNVPTLFIGSAASLANLERWLASKTALGLHPVGLLTLDDEPHEQTQPPFLGTLPDLSRLIDEKGAAQVILLEIPRTTVEGRYIIEACQSRGSRLLIYSNLAERLRHPLVTVVDEGNRFYTLQEEPLEDPVNRTIKRTLDLAIALPVVVFLLPPLMLLVWGMQRLQAPGRLFHVQERTGYGHRRFRMLKFRSMYDTKRDKVTEARQATSGDPRIYPFGRFLRRVSLDEFPQFWNVLRGQMSAIGPRPHLIAHDDLFAKQMNVYRTRFYVKPGITGLAQCRGFRGEITEPALLERRVECDLEYIANWSLWTDLWIAAKTVRQIFFPPKSAY